VNKAPSVVAEELGMQRSVVTAWKNGRNPRTATLMKIAEYFGVSVEELTAESSDMKKIPLFDGETFEDQLKFALAGDAGRDLTEEDMAAIRSFAAYTASERRKKK
jgi:transcriptional regulator with XRE-family HTH domain